LSLNTLQLVWFPRRETDRLPCPYKRRSRAECFKYLSFKTYLTAYVGEFLDLLIFACC
jgi:hypothetical protein